MLHSKTLLVFFLVFFVGCSVRTPAPVIDKSRQSAHAYVVTSNLCQANQAGEFCHVVEKGDTLYAISRRYGAKVVEIASRNGIKAPYIIKPGQRLIVRSEIDTTQQVISQTSSPRSFSQTKVTTTKPSETATATTRRSVATQPQPKRANTRTKQTRSSTTTESAPTVTPLKPILNRPHAGWQWPVAYQPLKGKGSNTAWDYMLLDGVEIVSATSGKVIYAGAGLNKFKHLVIVDTGTRYLLAYEFNSGHSIQEGQQLKTGQLITRIEKPSGLQIDSQERYKQFHFEIWANGKPVNPTTVIGVVAKN